LKHQRIRQRVNNLKMQIIPRIEKRVVVRCWRPEGSLPSNPNARIQFKELTEHETSIIEETG